MGDMRARRQNSLILPKVTGDLKERWQDVILRGWVVTFLIYKVERALEMVRTVYAESQGMEELSMLQVFSIPEVECKLLESWVRTGWQGRCHSVLRGFGWAGGGRMEGHRPYTQ